MRLCSIVNCGKKHRANGYCSRHNDQIRLYGKILERTKFDLNEIIVKNNICYMKIYNIKCIEIAETIFDLKYKSEIEKYKWCLDRNSYVVSNWYTDKGENKQMYLHGAIIHLSGQEVSDGQEIDHKDKNKLNNLAENLRVCTSSQNKYNKNQLSNNTSGYKGVSWHKRDKKWKAEIMVNKHHIFLGNFNNKEDAAQAYNQAAIQYHGEFAVLNNI